MYKHILLATDLTASSERIAHHAKMLAEACKAKLSMVHVVEVVPNVYSGSELTFSGGELTLASGANLTEIFVNNAKEKLEKLAGKLNIDTQDCHVVVNSIKQAVTDVAIKIHADLIVVGSHGKHGVQLLLGSGANAILHNAKCDVLAVRV